MKSIIVTAFITLGFLSCKKESEIIDPLRCGTISSQPVWAKNFSSDSLTDVSNLVFVMYNSKLPSGQLSDTSYSISVPIRFMANGTGILNNNISFSYNIFLTSNAPEIHITGLNDISSVFPFANTFLSQRTLKLVIENYMKTGGQFRFTNGVEYYSTAQKHESSYLSFNRN